MSGTTCCGVQAGSCFCGVDMKQFQKTRKPSETKLLSCEECGRLVPELVSNSLSCWTCHIRSIQKGKLK